MRSMYSPAMCIPADIIRTVSCLMDDGIHVMNNAVVGSRDRRRDAMHSRRERHVEMFAELIVDVCLRRDEPRILRWYAVHHSVLPLTSISGFARTLPQLSPCDIFEYFIREKLNRKRKNLC